MITTNDLKPIGICSLFYLKENNTIYEKLSNKIEYVPFLVLKANEKPKERITSKEFGHVKLTFKEEVVSLIIDKINLASKK